MPESQLDPFQASNFSMKELTRTLLIAFTLMGMVFSCSGHRVLEETSFELEETELEDLLTRRDESEHSNRRSSDLRSQHGRSRTQDTCDLNLRTLLLCGHTPTERSRLNGTGSYLII